MAEQSEPKVLNRWLVVIGATLIQLCLGALYAWKAFADKLVLDPYGFSRLDTQIIFFVSLLTFAVVMAFIAGPWQRKSGPRKVAMIGGLIMGLGYVIGGIAGTHFWGMLIGVGILGGAGVGLTYVCPIATLVKWFPDIKGFITGLGVAGFGFGALVWIKITSGFVFGPLDLTPGWKGVYGAGWTVNNVFLLYGILFAVLIWLGCTVLKNPPEGWKPAGWQPNANTKAGGYGEVNFTEKEMARTYQFWFLLITFTAGSMAGLMVIGIIGLFGQDALTGNGFDSAQAAMITGTAMALFYALMNGFGRIAWGSISEKTGRKNAIVISNLTQGILMILFYYVGKWEWGLYIGAALIGFNYGGLFALFPSITADYFGNKNVGSNYPWVFMAYGLGGTLGPILGGRMGDAHAWFWAFIPAGIVCLGSAALGMALRPPKSPTAA